MNVGKKSLATARVRSGLCVAVLSMAAAVLHAPPASAACASDPATNPITINPGPPFPGPIVIPGNPGDTLVVCASVDGDPAPEIDPDVTVDVRPFGCGVPCFVVEWDGVAVQPVTVSISVNSGSFGLDFQRTIPGGNYGSFCINAGQPCPE